MSNIYHEKYKEYYGSSWNPVAKKLLNVMRGMVEPVLQKYETGRHCKSQSYRACRVVDTIEAQIKVGISTPSERRDHRKVMELMRDKRLIKDFLAVHKTVWILDGRAV